MRCSPIEFCVFTLAQGGLHCTSLLQPELQPLSHVCIIRDSTHQIMLDAPADLSKVVMQWVASGGRSTGDAALSPSSRQCH
jgi:hypothetical protein